MVSPFSALRDGTGKQYLHNVISPLIEQCLTRWFVDKCKKSYPCKKYILLKKTCNNLKDQQNTAPSPPYLFLLPIMPLINFLHHYPKNAMDILSTMDMSKRFGGPNNLSKSILPSIS
jgi:hypothetical protein